MHDVHLTSCAFPGTCKPAALMHKLQICTALQHTVLHVGDELLVLASKQSEACTRHSIIAGLSLLLYLRSLFTLFQLFLHLLLLFQLRLGQSRPAWQCCWSWTLKPCGSRQDQSIAVHLPAGAACCKHFSCRYLHSGNKPTSTAAIVVRCHQSLDGRYACI